MEGTPTAVVPATPVTITAATRVNVNQLAVRQQLDVMALVFMYPTGTCTCRTFR